MRIRFEREHADIWQIHSAANVLGMKLFMVFPDRNIRSDVRADMNRIFLPHNSTKKCLGLMWTSVSQICTRLQSHSSIDIKVFLPQYYYSDFGCICNDFDYIMMKYMY